MANTVTIEKRTTEAQVAAFIFYVTFGGENVTTVTDDFDWDGYWANMKANAFYQAGEFFRPYAVIILCVIGVPCNILTFLIMKRLKPLTSTTFIMMVLAVTDTIALLHNAFTYRLMYYIFSSDAACQAHQTYGNFTMYISIWLVVLLTCERLVAVCFPIKASDICTVSNAHRAVIGLLAFDAVVNIVHTFVYEMEVHAKQISCPVKPIYGELMEAWGFVDAGIFVIVPLVVLILGNIAIIVQLRTSRDLGKLNNQSSTLDKSKRQSRSVTRMLLAVSVTTSVCLGPNAIIFIHGHTWVFSRSGDINYDAIKHFLYHMILFISYFNNAVNFFLYVLSGRRFRAVFFHMLSNLSSQISTV